MPEKINDVQARADALLARIGGLEIVIAVKSAAFLEKMEQIKAEASAVVDPISAELDAAAKELTALMKSNKAALFGGRDKVDLSHGALLFTRQPKVSIPRGALGKVKGLGWVEAVKVVESLDRDVVAKWSDERLFAIGAERKLVDKFAYETKAGR